MIFIPLFLFSAEINFYVDPVVYRSSIEIQDTITQESKIEDIYYVEFNTNIPYHELFYEEADSIIIAKAIVPFKLSNLNRPDSLLDTLYRQFTVPSFSEAARQQISFIVQFGMYVAEGKFKFIIEILSGNKKGLRDGVVEIKKENYRMSDVLVASEIIVDTVGTYLRKGNLRVTPHPSRIFNRRYTNFYIYYEIYDIIPDSNHLEIIYTIKDNSGKVIRQIPRRIDKRYKSQAINCGFSIKDFDPGQYSLTVLVKEENAQMVAQKETSFEITKAVQKEVTYEGMPYYEEIEYLLTPGEYKFFQSLPEEGKMTYLKRLWNVYNYFEIAERFEYADEHYRQGKTHGSKTDRGRIYIKFGKPDDIDRGKPIDYRESRPYEHWEYYNGLQFIFVDIRGTNEYTLIWTNAQNEQSQPSLYKYVPELKQELIK